MTLSIRVPATTANLGPGFDCLGLALDLWNEVRINSVGETLSITIEGEGKDRLPLDSGNLIYKSMRICAQKYSRSLPDGLSIHCENHIPMGSGLGSSSAAIVTGVLAARELFGLSRNPDEELSIAAEIEGHPDNVAPCLLGGLIAVCKTVSGYKIKKFDLPLLKMVIVLPDFDFPTEKARAALPRLQSLEAAIFNISRIPGLIDALTSGNLEGLDDLMDDRLHQPYRLPLIPGACDAMAAAYKAGASGVAISGAGPSLLAIAADSAKEQAIAEAIHRAFYAAGLNSRVFFPTVCNSGAVIL